jgi:hypothetical protein
LQVLEQFNKIALIKGYLLYGQRCGVQALILFNEKSTRKD